MLEFYTGADLINGIYPEDEGTTVLKRREIFNE
jgi:hypothetical protein